MVNAYEAAHEEINEAGKAYRLELEKYRAMMIGDADFLAAQKVYKAAEAKFDIAWEKARKLCVKAAQKGA